jgi:hypothetical protein
MTSDRLSRIRDGIGLNDDEADDQFAYMRLLTHEEHLDLMDRYHARPFAERSRHVAYVWGRVFRFRTSAYIAWGFTKDLLGIRS